MRIKLMSRYELIIEILRKLFFTLSFDHNFAYMCDDYIAVRAWAKTYDLFGRLIRTMEFLEIGIMNSEILCEMVDNSW